MSQRDLKGLFSALLVSFDEDGNVNEKGLRQIIRYNIDVNHMDGLYVGGSTGENFMLSTDEKKRIFEIAKDEAKDDLTLIAQVGSVNLKESVELAHFVTELGYDAISAVTPFYYKFTFDEIKHYYDTIINGVDNRMIIYSIPFLTGVDMSLSQFGELFKNPKIVGVKFTQADFYLRAHPQDFPGQADLCRTKCCCRHESRDLPAAGHGPRRRRCHRLDVQHQWKTRPPDLRAGQGREDHGSTWNPACHE